MRAFVPALRRLCRNLILDLRFGAFLGGTETSKLTHLGANNISNSDYGALALLLAPLLRADDVFVDVGCGKGRVLNWVLANCKVKTIYGLELDPAIAKSVSRRLHRFPQVHVVCGDAIENLPSEATLLYLFNPFRRAVMQRFKEEVQRRYRSRALDLRIVYYNAVDIDLFENDPAFVVTPVSLPAGFHPAGIIKFNASASIAAQN
jgi:hypothetical protein